MQQSADSLPQAQPESAAQVPSAPEPIAEPALVEPEAEPVTAEADDGTDAAKKDQPDEDSAKPA